MILERYIKETIAEAISTDAAYRTRIKFLFKNWITKFSDSYISYREHNYPSAWTVYSVSYAEDFQHQHIKLLYKESIYTDNTLIFEHEGSIYIVNDEVFAFAFEPDANDIEYLCDVNSLFKLSVSNFETALDVADNYDEFFALCEQMNEEEYKEQDNGEDEFEEPLEESSPALYSLYSRQPGHTGSGIHRQQARNMGAYMQGAAVAKPGQSARGWASGFIDNHWDEEELENDDNEKESPVKRYNDRANPLRRHIRNSVLALMKSED